MLDIVDEEIYNGCSDMFANFQIISHKYRCSEFQEKNSN